MSALHDELAAKAPSSRCLTCKFLSDLSPEDRDEWETELRLATNSNNAIALAMMRRGMRITEGAVRDHRQNHQ